MTDGEWITAKTDGFLMAIKLLERLKGLQPASMDETLRNGLRETAEGILTRP